MNYYLLVPSILLFILLIILYRTKGFRRIDREVKGFFIGRRMELKTKVYIVITSLVAVSMIALPIILFIIKDYHKLKVIIITLIIANIVGNLIKIVLKRERPLEKLVKETDYSFPSMHTFNGTIVYGLGIMLLGPIYSLLFIPLIILTGISRMYLGVHYFTDVIGGLAFGLLTLSIIGVFL